MPESCQSKSKKALSNPSCPTCGQPTKDRLLDKVPEPDLCDEFQRLKDPEREFFEWCWPEQFEQLVAMRPPIRRE